jgi:putative SOS response-associated peptidase YedK
MCGRFVLTVNPEMVQQEFNLTTPPAQMQPRYNIAPTQPVMVITNENPKEATYHKWGLIPSWAKDMSMASKMINARSESAAEKPAFRAAFRRRRCIIPTVGFYVWNEHDGKKTPMFVHRPNNELYGMAGLWEIWHDPDGGELRTCSILTTDANAFMQQFHHRMPVILHKDDYALWLSPKEEPLPVLQDLMKAYDVDGLQAYEVSKAVNRVSNDTPSLIEPFTQQYLL